MHARRFQIPALVSILSLVIGSCSILDNSIESKLNDQRALWQRKGITSYTYRFNWSCFCPPDVGRRVDVIVRNGSILEVRDAESGEKVEKIYTPYRTIEGLFDYIQEAIDADAAEITVEYDPELGYPRRVSIDRIAEAVDDEGGFLADSLRAE